MTDSAHAIREYNARHIALILDNDEPLHDACISATLESIVEDHGSGWALGQYADMLAGRAAHGYDRWDYARAAGSRIADLVSDWLAENIDTGSLAYRFAITFADTGDSDMWAMVAETFLPERIEDIPCPECGDETGACADACQNDEETDDEN